MTTPTTFEAAVHGPYIVTVVCGYPATPSNAAVSWVTSQTAHTLDDPREISELCAPRPTRRSVTGRMVQAGRLRLGDAQAQSQAENWVFQMLVPDGTYDLIATTADRIAMRRGIAISGDVALTSPIDAAQEGTMLVDVELSVANPAPGETLQASLGLETPTTAVPAIVYLGPIMTAKAIPDSALLATDHQTTSLRALKGNALRALRRPFRVGGDSEFSLPGALEGVQWAVENGLIAVSWASLPDLDRFTASVSGQSADGSGSASYSFLLTRRFLTETGIKRVGFDTSIPGYKAEWKADFARPVFRQLFGQTVADGVITSSSVSENLN